MGRSSSKQKSLTKSEGSGISCHCIIGEKQSRRPQHQRTHSAAPKTIQRRRPGYHALLRHSRSISIPLALITTTYAPKVSHTRSWRTRSPFLSLPPRPIPLPILLNPSPLSAPPIHPHPLLPSAKPVPRALHGIPRHATVLADRTGGEVRGSVYAVDRADGVLPLRSRWSGGCIAHCGDGIGGENDGE